MGDGRGDDDSDGFVAVEAVADARRGGATDSDDAGEDVDIVSMSESLLGESGDGDDDDAGSCSSRMGVLSSSLLCCIVTTRLIAAHGRSASACVCVDTARAVTATCVEVVDAVRRPTCARSLAVPSCRVLASSCFLLLLFSEY